MISEDEMLTILRAECMKMGTITKWAEKHNLKRGYIYNVLCKNETVGLSICLALGYRRKKILVFEKI